VKHDHPESPPGSDAERPARIYLARHGRTSLNAAGALRGRLDVPLDSVGERQALDLGTALAGLRPRLVVSSPLQRATQTAGAIARAAGIVATVDPRFIDRDYGRWAGSTVADVVLRWGSLDAAPGVELLGAVRERVVAAMADVAETAVNGPAVVVAHDIVNRLILAALDPGLGSPDDLAQETGCFNVLECTRAVAGASTWRALSINEVPGSGVTVA